MLLLSIGVALALGWVLVDLASWRRREPRPAPGPPAGPGEEERRFSWRVQDPLAGVLLLDLVVAVRRDAYADARSRLLADVPGKVFHRSEEECFGVARVEVLDPEAGSGAPELGQVAAYLLRVADDGLLSNYQLADLVLSFAHEQCIRYSYDKDSTGYDEYFRFPLETVFDTTGDCDCKAVLACALYKALGFGVALALMPGHAAVAVTSDWVVPYCSWSLDGRPWYYCEATGDNWLPGAVPSDIDARTVKLRQI